MMSLLLRGSALFLVASLGQTQSALVGHELAAPASPSSSASAHSGVYVHQGPRGLVVSEVLPESAAARAGLQPGDELLAVGGERLEGYASLAKHQTSCAAGKPLALALARGESRLKLLLATAPLASRQDDEPEELPWIGIYLAQGETQLTIAIVVEGSPAQRAGLLSGDRLLALGETQLADEQALIDFIDESKVGDDVRVLVERAGRALKLDLTLAAYVQELADAARERVPMDPIAEPIGTADGPPESIEATDAAEASPDVLELLDAEITAPATGGGYMGVSLTEAEDGGVEVHEVREGFPAAAAGLQAGDVIRQINRDEIESLDGLSQVLSGLSAGDRVRGWVQRGDAREGFHLQLVARPDVPEFGGMLEEELAEADTFEPLEEPIEEPILRDGVLEDAERPEGRPFLGVVMAGETTTVDEVMPDSAASRGGLQAGDVLRGLGPERVSDLDSLLAALDVHHIGQRTVLHIEREGRPMGLVVDLGSAPSEGPSPRGLIPAPAPAVDVGGGWLGVYLSDDGEGVVTIGELFGDGPAAQAGLQAGDRILRIGDHAIGDAADLSGALGRLSPGRRVPVLVIRDGDDLLLPVRLGERPGQDAAPAREPELAPRERGPNSAGAEDLERRLAEMEQRFLERTQSLERRVAELEQTLARERRESASRVEHVLNAEVEILRVLERDLEERVEDARARLEAAMSDGGGQLRIRSSRSESDSQDEPSESQARLRRRPSQSVEGLVGDAPSMLRSSRRESAPRRGADPMTGSARWPRARQVDDAAQESDG